MIAGMSQTNAGSRAVLTTRRRRAPQRMTEMHDVNVKQEIDSWAANVKQGGRSLRTPENASDTLSSTYCGSSNTLTRRIWKLWEVSYPMDIVTPRDSMRREIEKR